MQIVVNAGANREANLGAAWVSSKTEEDRGRQRKTEEDKRLFREPDCDFAHNCIL